MDTGGSLALELHISFTPGFQPSFFSVRFPGRREPWKTHFKLRRCVASADLSWKMKAPMITQLLQIIKEAIRAVPAMKYALAVAGIISVVAMVGALKLSPQAAVFGAVITLVLMVAMVVFAKLTTVAPRHFFLPVQVMMWSFLGVIVATTFLLFTCAFFQWPKGLRDLIGPAPGQRDGRAKEVGHAKEAQGLIAEAPLQLKARDDATPHLALQNIQASNLSAFVDASRTISQSVGDNNQGTVVQIAGVSNVVVHPGYQNEAQRIGRSSKTTRST